MAVMNNVNVHSKSATQGSEAIKTPSKYDILLGRNSLCWNHPGNIYFRDVIGKYHQLYKDASTRREKSGIILKILQELQKQGSRFLEIDKAGNCWVPSSQNARDKISNALRDKFPNTNGGTTSTTGAPSRKTTTTMNVALHKKTQQQQQQQRRVSLAKQMITKERVNPNPQDGNLHKHFAHDFLTNAIRLVGSTTSFNRGNPNMRNYLNYFTASPSSSFMPPPLTPLSPPPLTASTGINEALMKSSSFSNTEEGVLGVGVPPPPLSLETAVSLSFGLPPGGEDEGLLFCDDNDGEDLDLLNDIPLHQLQNFMANASR